MSHLLHDLEKKQRHFYSIVEKYGYGDVPAAQVYDLFHALANLGNHDFIRVTSSRYARQVTHDIFHILKLQALKGAGYSIWWGVSLPFLPHAQGARVRWHRTLKSADLDLFEEPVDYFGTRDLPFPEGLEYFTQNGHGEVYLGETMQRMWGSIEQPVLTWFAAASTLPGVLDKAIAQLARKSAGVGHNPDPRLVCAFTLRQLGRLEEGRSYLAAARERARSAVEAELLRSAFDAPA